ncbi:MAG: hypothetical protein ACJAX5_001307 [Patiriisocius sp.]|jgi:hypothetical protein
MCLWFCAKATASLDQISNGRFELGIGASWNAAEFLLQNEVERMILSIPGDDEEGAFSHLEQIASAIGEYSKSA